MSAYGNLTENSLQEWKEKSMIGYKDILLDLPDSVYEKTVGFLNDRRTDTLAVRRRDIEERTIYCERVTNMHHMPRTEDEHSGNTEWLPRICGMWNVYYDGTKL